ncbi:cupin domain-containing protein [Nakamurella lactea]|uniref:cupin domain-containing protein n=1 Tax=Nakamurella lactea TaxID=459515 RepID=UPI0003F9DB36|nr:cupin domain-containing protein [Nakamurella lactea]
MESISLTELAVEQLAAAQRVATGRSAVTVLGGRGRTLRQIVLAFVAGKGLDDHEAPGEATLQVLRGRVRLATEDDNWEGTAGDLLTIPALRHNLEALDDSVVLLSVSVPQR